MYDKNNIFAKIIRKEVPSKIIFENDFTIAFNDIDPAAPIHILVLPKGEFVDYADFLENAASELINGYFSSINEIAKLLSVKDYRLITNKGKEAGQSVFHFHMHFLAGVKMESVL